MAFDGVPADAYELFMGRFSTPLSQPFATVGLEGVGPLERVLDVGCGPGMLTAELVRRLGGRAVSAVDPAAGFVATTAERFPDSDVRRAAAEDLPFGDDVFDAALAQLVVHFMRDPRGGVREMARVTRPGGRVTACVWDHGGGASPLATFWRVVLRLDPEAEDEGALAGGSHGQLTTLLQTAGLEQVSERLLSITVAFPTFAAWWDPFTYGVGPAGDYVTTLDQDGRTALAEALRDELGSGPFEVTAGAWTATGLVPAGTAEPETQ